ncbi:MAG: PilZ domain-containing protein [Myxococcales bacterium]|nr:PilZ domain-containing protein [Myxococcales bacterium]
MGERELIVGETVQLVSSHGSASCTGIIDALERDLIHLRVQTAQFHKGDVVRIQHVVHDDARYTLNAIVERGGAPLMVVKPLGDWVRIQQREYVRLRVDAAVWADVHADPVGPVRRHPIDMQARVIDISAGGCQLESNQRLQIGDRLFIRFELPETQPIATTAIVVRAGRLVKSGSRYGLRFISLTPQLETAILRWIYEQQVARRRRTLV